MTVATLLSLISVSSSEFKSAIIAGPGSNSSSCSSGARSSIAGISSAISSAAINMLRTYSRPLTKPFGRNQTAESSVGIA